VILTSSASWDEMLMTESIQSSADASSGTGRTGLPVEDSHPTDEMMLDSLWMDEQKSFQSLDGQAVKAAEMERPKSALMLHGTDICPVKTSLRIS